MRTPKIKARELALLRLVLLGIILCAVILSAVGCHSSSSPENVTPEMRDAYAVTSQLYKFTWNSSAFHDKGSEREIQSLLDRLTTDFHRVERKAPLQMFEPGFAVTLEANRSMLRDIRSRFADGSKDYAQWRLQSLSEGCISCHSRFSASVDFVGAPPSVTTGSAEERFARAQFLLATRQFDEASDDLLSLAKAAVKSADHSSDAFRALQLWLVIQVRVKSRFHESAQDLQRLLPGSHFATYQVQSVQNWIRDLETLERRPLSNSDGLTEARSLLDQFTSSTPGSGAGAGSGSVVTDTAEDRDLRSMVNTLRASAVLHIALQSIPRSDKRRTATYLLAVAYQHLPIPTFDLFRDLYLEQCIREFPNSLEAQKAFRAYEQSVKNEATGSGGIHIDKEQLSRLEALRGLAFADPTDTAAATDDPETGRSLKMPHEQ